MSSTILTKHKSRDNALCAARDDKMLNYESRCFAVTLQDGDRTWVTKVWATREQHARDIIYLSEEGTTNIAKIEATGEVRIEEYPSFWSSFRKRNI